MTHAEVVRKGVTRPSMVLDCLEAHDVGVLNVAGHRESVCPGIGERVERFMRELFRQLGHVAVG